LAKPHSSSSKVVEDLALGLQQQHQGLLGRLLKPRQQLLVVVLVALGRRQQQVEELPVAVLCLVKQQQQLVEVVGVGSVGLEQQQVGQVALDLEVVLLLLLEAGRRSCLVRSWMGEGVLRMIGWQVALQQHQQQRRQCRLGRQHLQQQHHLQQQMEQQQRLLQVLVLAIAAAARVV
jgi:hypothetical protein